MALRMFIKTSSVLGVLLSAFIPGTYGQDPRQNPLQYDSADEPPRHRIAIIGAGAGGSSTAYHLAKFYNETQRFTSLHIDIFETNSRVGGRTTTVDALNDPRYPTEVGASIFVEVNHVLYNLTQDFNLSTRDKIYESTGSLYDLGVWDGSSFVFTINNSDDGDGNWKGRWRGYWDIVKLLWKYGLSPIRTQRAKNGVVSSFLRMYDEYFPISGLTNFASTVGLTDYTGITGQAALAKNSVSEQFSREIVQSSTRVNYAQNLNSIHGLETIVCMAIEGAMAIEGGNWQIFDEAVKRSGANLYLNTTVASITKTPQGKYQLQTKPDIDSSPSSSSALAEYDTVILASPLQFSNITFTPPLPPATSPKPIDYVTLHVTLFATPYRPSPRFFGLDSQDEVPDSVLTTLPLNPELFSSTIDDGTTSNPPRGIDAVGPTQFWSLSTLRVMNPEIDEFPASLSDEDLVAASKLPHNLLPHHSHSNTDKRITNISQPLYLYKIFSPTAINASFLTTLFDFPLDSDSDFDSLSSLLPSSIIPWIHTKTWHSYPYLPPTTNFSSLLLDSPFPAYTDTFNHQVEVKAVRDPRNAVGVWYTSGVEGFISTMETSALMGRNVARLVVDGLMEREIMVVEEVEGESAEL